MKNGQISLEFLLTLMVLIIASASLLIISNNILETQSEIFLENQLKLSAHKLSLFITSSQSLDDTNFYSKTKIKPLNYDNTLFFPTIQIEENKITLKETISGKNIEVEETFYKNANTIVEIEKNYLVIKNE